jgi:predicted AlkP superfamily phosphohydrolase/phosphomutase
MNLVGREPDGKVNPGPEAEALCDALIGDLMDIVKPDTGDRLVEEVVRVADTYQGDYVDELPDLLVIWNRKTPITAFGSPKIGRIEADYPGNRTGDHTPRGLFFACGPGISPCALSDKISVMDVGTTIMSWLGPIPPDMDGAPIPEFRRTERSGTTVD